MEIRRNGHLTTRLAPPFFMKVVQTNLAYLSVIRKKIPDGTILIIQAANPKSLTGLEERYQLDSGLQMRDKVTPHKFPSQQFHNITA